MISPPVKEFQVPGFNGGEVIVRIDGDYDGEWLTLLPWRQQPGGYISLAPSFRWSVHNAVGEIIGWEEPLWCHLHQWILPPKKGFWVAFKNGNKLDCRSSNLEYATPSDIAMRREQRSYPKQSTSAYGSKYRGVKMLSQGKIGTKSHYVFPNKWVAVCRKKHVGTFNSELEAAQAYDKAAINCWGEAAILNFKETK